MKEFFRSIEVRAVFAAVMTVLLAAGTLGGLALHDALGTLDSMTYARFGGAVRAVADEVARTLDEATSSVQMLSHTLVETTDAVPLERRGPLFTSGNTREIAVVMELYRRSNSVVRSIALTDRESLVTASWPHDASLVGITLTKYPRYGVYPRLALTGKLAIGDVFLSPRRRAPIMTILAPILSPAAPGPDGTGEVLGLISAAIDFNVTNFLSRVSHKMAGKDGRLLLLDHKFRRIADTALADPSQIVRTTEEVVISERSGIVSHLKGPGEPGRLYFGYGIFDSEEVAMAALLIPESRWTVLATAPRGPVEASWKELRRRMISVGVVVILIASLGAGLLARRAVARVLEIAEVVSLVEEDNFSRRPSLQGDDEIAELARAVDRLADRLEKLKIVETHWEKDPGNK